jgi:hypothetical protein
MPNGGASFVAVWQDREAPVATLHEPRAIQVDTPWGFASRALTAVGYMNSCTRQSQATRFMRNRR